MIERGYIYVAGPAGAGRMTLVPLILEVIDGPALAVRGVRRDAIEALHETSSARDAELREYREAGATAVARFRFTSEREDGDGFFCSAVMSDYSNAMIIEGDGPIDFIDLEVFVAPQLLEGEALLRRVEQPQRQLAKIRRALGDGPAVAAVGRNQSRETSVKAAIALAERGTPPGTKTSWKLAKTHEGLERAGLVIVNIREDRQRLGAERMLIEIACIRTSEEVRRAVLGQFAHRTPITAVVADLSVPTDPGTKTALARIKRAIVARTKRA